MDTKIMNKAAIDLVNKIENKSILELSKYILVGICGGSTMYIFFFMYDFKISYSTRINLNELALFIIGVINIIGFFNLIMIHRNKQIIFLFGSICALFCSLGIILFTYGLLYEITNSIDICNIYKYCSLSIYILILILSYIQLKRMLYKKIENKGSSTWGPAVASTCAISGTFILKRVMNNLSDKNACILEIVLADMILPFSIFCIPFLFINYILSKKLKDEKKIC